MFHSFGFNMFHDLSRPFNNSYKCYSVSMLPGNERHDVEKGGKIIMPPSALDQLTRLNVEYPMLFRLSNRQKNRTTHAGVLEFVADEGNIYIPNWMMSNLLLTEGELIQVESVSLPVATFSKFQPQSPDFLDITNPKAVLENALRNFACLTTNDLIAIKYNQRVYELCVLETKPGNAVSIIECDMNVDFAAPVGYKEPERVPRMSEPMTVDNPEVFHEPAGFFPFQGEGNRLDGKKKKDSISEPVMVKKNYIRGVPDYDHQYGLIRFDRSVRPISDGPDPERENENGAEEPEPFQAFQGQGFSLKKGRK